MGGIDAGKDVSKPPPPRGSLTEIRETGKTRRVSQALKTATGPQAFEASDAAASLDEAIAKIKAEEEARRAAAVKKAEELGDSAGETG